MVNVCYGCPTAVRYGAVCMWIPLLLEHHRGRIVQSLSLVLAIFKRHRPTLPMFHK